MKTLRLISARVLRRLVRLVPVIMAASSLAAEPAPKTHRLFMGSNLTIVTKDSALPVSDVRKNSFVVNGPGGAMVVDTQDPKFQLKIDDALKLTATFATVDQLTFERAYTPGKDPMQKFANSARTGAYMAEGNDEAAAAVRRTEAGVGISAGNLANTLDVVATDPTAVNGPIMIASANAQLAGAGIQADIAQRDSVRAELISGMDAISTTSTSNRLTTELAAEAFDAVRVTFKVSAPRPMTTPYAVIFMRFLEQKDRPDTASVWVYAEKLPDIGEHPRTITILRGGFPPGYHIDSYHVHLYEGTAEIATNVSRKQVELTTDEAFQYSVIQHISGRRDQTRDPVKATAYWPGDLSSRLLPEKLTRTVYVKVDKTGKVLGIYEDQACHQPVADGEIAELAPELRFFPALAKGKPVEGIAAVKLGPRS